MMECHDPRRSTLVLNFPMLALDHDANALHFPTLERTILTHLHSSLTLALDHDAHTLDYPTLAYDLGAHAPNHARTTTTRSRCARDSVTRAAQCQDRGAHIPRS